MSNPPIEPGPPMDYLPPPRPPSGGPMALSITALVIGCLSCPSALLPICGCPIGIAGIVCGALALKGAKTIQPNGAIKGMALTGLILSSIGMLGTIINAVWGAYLGAQGKLFHP